MAGSRASIGTWEGWRTERRGGIERKEGDRLYADKALVVWRSAPSGAVVISGSIDHHNAGAVARSLAAELCRDGESPAGAAQPDRDLHVDVRQLEFSDVSGINAIVDVARRAAEGRLILHGLPDAIARVMAVVGWSDLPGLVVDEK